MKKLLYLIVISFLVISPGCTGDFDEMNVNPNGLSEVTDAKLFLLPMLIQGYTKHYQVAVNLYHDLYSQHWANMNAGFNSGYYAHHDGWIQNYWKDFYVNFVFPNLKEIQAIAEEDPKSNNIAQIAKIWSCFLTSHMVDTWGDIPYTEAGTPGTKVAYDKGEDIYKSIIADLDLAANSFKTDGQLTLDSQYDPIFGGDINKWQFFAQTIRARLSMRMVNYDPVFARDNFLDAYQKGIILNQSDNALQPCDGTNWKFEYLNYTKWVENGMSKTMENHLRNTSSVVDPRMELWFQECGNGGYNGIANGDNINASKNTAVYSIGNREYFKYDMSYVVAIASDSKFMLAEAALRGWISGDVKSIVEEGVGLNMDYWGVEESKKIEYLVGLPELPEDKESQLKYIITQRWLGNFTNPKEAWSNFRRTDYPELMPIIHNLSSTVPNGHFIKRIRYINNEFELNESMPVKITEDSQNERIFWDTSDDTAVNFQ